MLPVAREKAPACVFIISDEPTCDRHTAVHVAVTPAAGCMQDRLHMQWESGNRCGITIGVDLDELRLERGPVALCPHTTWRAELFRHVLVPEAAIRTGAVHARRRPVEPSAPFAHLLECITCDSAHSFIIISEHHNDGVCVLVEHTRCKPTQMYKCRYAHVRVFIYAT